ncbi:hypothetical protein H4684_004144, partial [Desulfomicrobium macestii]|nr:hypothetical protein [Desulfomicrobium macestii]
PWGFDPDRVPHEKFTQGNLYFWMALTWGGLQCHGSQRFKIIAQDRSYIEERMASGIWWERLTYKMWYYCSDCGQSMFFWGILSLILAFAFGILYYSIGGSNFNTAFLKGNDGNPGFWALQYYSIVTFTTLGFGDIVPKTGVAAFLVTLEVITGYIMLGGLIAIFANRLAKRND